MHILVVFYFFLALLCLDHLQGRITRNEGISFDLIHRYSPKAPRYNSSMTLQERNLMLVRHSSIRHRRHTKRIKDNDLETELVPNDGDYLIRVRIGSPPLDIYAVADTGSDLIWFQCQPCDACYPQTTTMFDPTKSSTYHILPCSSTYCTRNNPSRIQCDPDNPNQCEYFYAYGNGSTISSGILSTDKFTFSSNVAPSCVFGCGILQTGEFDDDSSGLVGLGGGSLSLISQLGSTIAYKFSYCLNTPTSKKSSRLRLGTNQGTPGSKTSVTTPLLTQNVPTYYMINLEGIGLANHQQIAVNKGIIIDSGSTLTYINPSAYSRLEAVVRKAITAKPIANPPEELSLCYDKKSKFDVKFNLVLHLDGGEVILLDTNFLINFEQHICFAIVPTQEEDDPMILGNVAQINFEIEFDLKAKTVSFTPTNCNQDN